MPLISITHLRASIHHRADSNGDEEGDGADAMGAVYPKFDYYADGCMCENGW